MSSVSTILTNYTLAIADIWAIFANFVPLSNVNDEQELDIQHFG